jgi:hypothetical protein
MVVTAYIGDLIYLVHMIWVQCGGYIAPPETPVQHFSPVSKDHGYSVSLVVAVVRMQDRLLTGNRVRVTHQFNLNFCVALPDCGYYILQACIFHEFENLIGSLEVIEGFVIEGNYVYLYKTGGGWAVSRAKPA